MQCSRICFAPTCLFHKTVRVTQHDTSPLSTPRTGDRAAAWEFSSERANGQLLRATALSPMLEGLETRAEGGRPLSWLCISFFPEHDARPRYVQPGSTWPVFKYIYIFFFFFFRCTHTLCIATCELCDNMSVCSSEVSVAALCSKWANVLLVQRIC